MEMLQLTFTLLVCYQVKHFICDFPLQREYMLKKTLPGWDFLLPLTVHAGVHALFTLAILLVFAPALWYFAIFDFIVHFGMDRIKSGPRYLGRFNDHYKASFWWCFGIDQMVHHFTHYFIIYKVVTYLGNH
tara:strand:+ start:56137 stop:56529 length:393 start_codon:yes stop_codon:yes gene_type:complete